MNGASFVRWTALAIVALVTEERAGIEAYGGSPIPVELLDRAVWRFLKGKRHLTASASLNTNWRTSIGKASRRDAGKVAQDGMRWAAIVLLTKERAGIEA